MTFKDMILADLDGDSGGGYPEPTGTKQISITDNGTVTENVKDFAEAEIDVNVPQPSGKIAITSNGTDIDVAQYALADVAVANVVKESKDVNFYDYDGTIVYSYTAQEFLQLSAMPDNPDRTSEGLTARGWNWNFADAQSYVASYGVLNIGQLYRPTSNNTEIDIDLDGGRLSPTLGLGLNGSAEIDWGDGSAKDTISGSSTSTVTTVTHTYSAAGSYTISIKTSSGSTYKILGDSVGSKLIWAGNASTSTVNRCYQYSVKRVRISNAYSGFSAYAFAYCANLESVSIPLGSVILQAYMFAYCYSLRAITLGEGDECAESAFRSCYQLKMVSLPKNISTTVSNSQFINCYKLSTVMLPESITKIYDSAFIYCYFLQYVVISKNVIAINSNAFAYCSSIGTIIFGPSTPPDAISANWYTNLPTNCKIYVPQGSLSAYTSATNYPSSQTYQYIEY